MWTFLKEAYDCRRIFIAHIRKVVALANKTALATAPRLQENDNLASNLIIGDYI